MKSWLALKSRRRNFMASGIIVSSGERNCSSYYFAIPNLSRMQYGTFRAAGYFIGSGVVEAGCKTVIGGRCKQSGMFWSEPGAENILAFRCIHSSRRLEEFWKYRLNTNAARNDCLHLAA